MGELIKFYEIAKSNAKDHMKEGNINLYLNDLIVMNRYKSQIEAA